METKKCSYIYPDKIRRCNAFSTRSSNHCIAHTDDKQRRDQAAARMKSTKRNKLAGKTVAEILAGEAWDLRTVSWLLKQIMNEFYLGEIEAPKAQLLGTLSNAATRALSQGELEARLEELERRLREAS